MLFFLVFRVSVHFISPWNGRYTTIWLIFSFLSSLRFLMRNYLSAIIIPYRDH
jgi:NADH:ubiquinone oxidoreductase subunit 3 (subunit A)